MELPGNGNITDSVIADVEQPTGGSVIAGVEHPLGGSGIAGAEQLLGGPVDAIDAIDAIGTGVYAQQPNSSSGAVLAGSSEPAVGNTLAKLGSAPASGCAHGTRANAWIGTRPRGLFLWACDVSHQRARCGPVMTDEALRSEAKRVRKLMRSVYGAPDRNWEDWEVVAMSDFLTSSGARALNACFVHLLCSSGTIGWWWL